MVEESVLTWFGTLLNLNGGGSALKLAKTREGFVAKFGTFTSPPCPDLIAAASALRDMLRKAMTSGA